MPAAPDKKVQPIVIKRIKKVAGGHHGGAWKIAYADFVTAMMAFFLLMWLLGSTTKGDLQGIADYFSSPMKVALTGGSGSGDSSSLIKGGGTDLTRTVGQVKRGEVEARNRNYNLQALRAENQRRERDQLVVLGKKVEDMLMSNPRLAEFRSQIRLDLTSDGLRIQIVDEKNRPMFDTGSAVVKDYMRDLLRSIGKVLNDVPNRITLSGHTDSSNYGSGDRGYSNWELSADRANASRRELIAGGMQEAKLLRVVGLGAALPLDPGHPSEAINRRISLTVMNQDAEERVLQSDRIDLPSDATPETTMDTVSQVRDALQAVGEAAPAVGASNAAGDAAPKAAASLPAATTPGATTPAASTPAGTPPGKSSKLTSPSALAASMLAAAAATIAPSGATALASAEEGQSPAIRPQLIPRIQLGAVEKPVPNAADLAAVRALQATEATQSAQSAQSTQAAKVRQ